MLAVCELLLAWYRIGFLGRSSTPLGSQPGSSCQSFLSIVTVAWFPENSWPKLQNALAPFSDLHAFFCTGLLGLGTQCFSSRCRKKSRSLAVPFRPVPGGDAPLPGHDEPERCLSVSSPRSVSVGQLALGWHAVCYPSPPCRGPDTMHRFSNALGELCHLWYDFQLTTGCGSLRADPVRFLPCSLHHARSHHCPCYFLLHRFARVIHHRLVALLPSYASIGMGLWSISFRRIGA